HELYIDGRVPDFSTFTSPKLLATHVPFASLPKSVQDSKTKLVYLCRNPRDTFISMWHFTNNLLLHHNGTNSIEETFDLFCEGVSLNGPFWNHVLDFGNKLRNLEVNTNGHFSTGDAYNLFFRKGEIGDWKNYYTTEISDKLNHTIEEKFQGSELKFSYV
uniref:Sulfotransferase n=1 Tax=Solanum lycopersicum TaxID=4081 RepID=A0A3Q7IED9_SOLLC